MKKIIIIFASLVSLLLSAAIAIPILYEDDIKALIQKSINENLEARVFLNPARFEVSIFKNFPNPTASIGDFGIVGLEPFEGDTLLSVDEFNITIDLFSLFGNNYRVKSINLDRPRIQVKVLSTGEANYEVVPEEEETTGEVPKDGSSSFNLSIDRWSISEGFISYDDRSTNTMVTLVGLQHQGSGNISLDIYDLKTTTTIEQTFISYEGDQYFSGQRLFADAMINIDLEAFKFTFKENLIQVNDFPLSFDGYVAMPGEDINMDITFASTNSSIKSLYSLAPGAYTEGYENVKAEGTMTFSGLVKGIYNEQSMPAFQVNLQASNGQISYPELPTPIENINIQMLVDCSDGVIDNTSVDISEFHLDLGSNPINGSLLINNLKDYDMKADLSAKLNLAELSNIFPLEGLDMKGLFSFNVKAEGVYDSTGNRIPSTTAMMQLEDGYIKSAEFPKALERISFNSNLNATSGNMEEAELAIEDLSMHMEGEELKARLILKDFVDYQWDLDARGSLDLEVISEVYPVEDMKYAGKLLADIHTSGKYSDVKAERYDRIPTKGEVQLSDFTFESPDLPQGMKISNARVTVNPKGLNVNEFSGTIGKSDVSISGYISNYIDYIFRENALLNGKMSLNSRLLDLNEFLSEEVANAGMSTEDSIPMQALAIPRNIDFEFNSSINKILYDNLSLNKTKGLLTVRDGVLEMSDLSFDILGGSVVMSGKYDTRIPEKPAFAYQLNVQKLSIPQAYTSFSTVQRFAPMAQIMNGDFSTKFSINGRLKDDMTPIYESLNGSGLIQIAEAFVKESKLVSGIAGFVKSDLGSNQLKLNDVIMKASIENGRAHVSPFDVQIGKQKATISGSIGADGTLDYMVNTEVDAGVVGQQVNQLLATLQGNDAAEASSKITLHFNVGGTYDKPKINLEGTTTEDGTSTSIKAQMETEVKKEVEQQMDEAKKEVEQQVEQETEKLLEEAEEQIQTKVDTITEQITRQLDEEASNIIGEELDSTANELKESLKSIFKKKKKN